MDAGGSQGGRPILGRAKGAPQGDTLTQTPNCNAGSCGDDGTSDADRLGDALKQQCEVTTSRSDGQTNAKGNVAGGADAGCGSWNLHASEFVPTFGQSAASTTAASEANTQANAEPVYEYDPNDAAVCYELACALERLAKAPGSFSEEAANIVSIFEHSVTTAKQAQLAADSIVQYAIAYRSFTYDAASLCQHIATHFRREFGQSRYIFRDFLLISVEKEHKQLETYVAAGARDRPNPVSDTAAGNDGMWTPYEYRAYVNGLAQLTGFVFMNVVGERGQRISSIGRTVRSTLLLLLRAADSDYLDSVLIILKECGRPLAELDDANGEWSTVVDTLDELLANSQPGASLLTDPSAPPVTAETKGAPCLRISVPLRNQLRRFVDQARGWTRAPNPTLPTPNGVALPAATAASAE